MTSHNRILGGTLLVSGTTIGAGMLGLPVSTGLAGFIPALILFVFCWLYMTYTAFLLLEVNLWMEPDTNLITMAKRTLGRTGEFLSWGVYLFLLYALTTAYLAGSGTVTVAFIHLVTGIMIPPLMGSIPMLLLFSYFVYKGTASVDRINRFLMSGLALICGIIIVWMTPQVESQQLWFVNWPSLWLAISLVITSFGFHIIIPSLTTYLHGDISALKKVLWIGSLIPLLIYIAWEVIILGIIPVDGAQGLAQGYVTGIDGAQLLSAHLPHFFLALCLLLFSFFVITTSFLGVSLSLSDCLADGLKIKHTTWGKMILYILTFVPPLLFTLTNPRAFFMALEYAGAYGVAVLLGFLPALMVWRGRYYLHYSSTFRVPGGKLALLFVMAVAVLVMLIEAWNKLFGI